MPYQRKTEDEFRVQQNAGYGDGWETVHVAVTRQEAEDVFRDYRKNMPTVPMRIVKRRVSIEV